MAIQYQAVSPDQRLSDREFEVLRSLGSGTAVKDVATPRPAVGLRLIARVVED